jgi:hypothetical protein
MIGEPTQANMEIAVSVDIKPGSCPNSLNVGSRGVLPVAIVGTADFDATTVDPVTVALDGVPPLRWSLEDVATPFAGDPFSCHDFEGDGQFDLSFKFNTQEIAGVIGAACSGDEIVLTLTGETFDGVPIEGEDAVVIRLKGDGC